MIHHTIKVRAIYLIALLVSPFILHAQQEEVRVVKPYTPTLSGAEKIQVLPRIEESVSYEQPDFAYQIFPKRYETDYRVTPIKPARMIQPSLDRLYKSELKLGAGNYLTPLAELRINQLRSSKGTFGMYLGHHSMNGKVKLDNDAKVDGGFSENELKVSGKRFQRRSIFDYEAGAAYNSYVHYGVNPVYSDTVTREGFSHPFFRGYAQAGIKSARTDDYHLQYNAKLDYLYFTHDFDQMEHGARLRGDVSGIIRDFRVGSKAGVWFLNHPGGWDTLATNRFVINVDPYISKSSEEWRFRIGINSYTMIRDGNARAHFYVKGNFSFNIVEEVLVPYMGVDGYQDTYSYSALTTENPYIVPGLMVNPANNRIYAYLGLKGKVTNYLAWNIRASYRAVDDQFFFVTDTSNVLHNQFQVVYDDMTVMNLHGELNIAPTSSFRVLLKGNYYSYQMVREPEAWYRPDFDLSLQARYNLGDKILADAGLFVIGPRYYKSVITGPALTEPSPSKIGTTLDLNLGVEYRYTKLLSFWAKFNNMTAQPYYMWNNYPSYRFRFMLGFTYGL